MKKTLALFCLFITAFSGVNAQTRKLENGVVKIEAKPEKGFYSCYLLVLPDSVKDKDKAKTVFVIPNNSGKIADNIEVQEKDAFMTAGQMRTIVNMLQTPALIPVFPRTESDWQIYTHALDRDVMTTNKKELRRTDLQLIAMLNDAKEILDNKGIKTGKKIFMMGFSASGMFTNRFAMLHPELIKAAAIGSPGGMPMVPVNSYNGVSLRYPIGTADLKEITSAPLKLELLYNLPLYFYLGNEDNNDSVVYRDSFEQEDEDLIMANFGKTLQERWNICKKLYADAGLKNSRFVSYPGAGHQITEEMKKDLIQFFVQNLE